MTDENKCSMCDLCLDQCEQLIKAYSNTCCPGCTHKIDLTSALYENQTPLPPPTDTWSYQTITPAPQHISAEMITEARKVERQKTLLEVSRIIESEFQATYKAVREKRPGYRYYNAEEVGKQIAKDILQRVEKKLDD